MGLLNLQELSGLGQSECGPAPGLGPGEKSMCCPELGWVIYDAGETGYALCERALAQQSGGSDSASIPSGSSSYDAELAARRQAMEARRISLEEQAFQRKLQAVVLKGQLARAAAARASTPEAVAARAAASRQAAAAARRAEERRKAEDTKKYLTYGVAALFAAKIFKLF